MLEIRIFIIEKKSLRDADINTYKDTIEYLIKNGYSVVRLGHSNSSKVNFDFDKNFFDYSKSPFKSPEIDVFLLSHCIFLLVVHLDQLTFLNYLVSIHVM